MTPSLNHGENERSRQVCRQHDRLGRAAYAAYDAAGVLASALCIPAAPVLIARGLGTGIGERLGRLPREALALPGRPLWVHAASVGEALAAAPLIAEVRRRRPALPVVFSTTTATGRAVARAEVRPDAALLLPIDAWHVVDRALARIRPRALVVVETELWPGLLRAAAAVGAPAVVVSGRLSARALARYAWFAPLFRAALRKVSAFAMQTEEDARRIIALGAPPERVRVAGSLKSSRCAPAAALPFAALGSRPVLIAASTQPGEEDLVLDAASGWWSGRCEHADGAPLLVIAPRRPERFESVARLVGDRGLRYQRLSAMQDLGDSTQVLVLDTLGDLVRFLPAARAVFVGGTVAPLGGHNLLEPAACGKPIAFGPHTENVAAAAEALLARGGAERVRSAADLARFWSRCLADRALAERMGDRAREVASGSPDVLAQTWEILAPFLGDEP